MRECDLIAMFLDLLEREFEQLQRVPELIPMRVIRLERVQAEKDGVDAASPDTREINLTVLVTVTDVATQGELPVDHVGVGIHHEHRRLGA